jgi:hypothetical protein
VHAIAMHSMGWGLTMAGARPATAWQAAAGHLAARMQKRTRVCVAKLCPDIVIGHECCLPDARSEA